MEDFWEAATTEGHPERLDAMKKLMNQLGANGEYAAALATGLALVDLAEAQGETKVLAKAGHRVASRLIEEGNPKDAIAMLERILEKDLSAVSDIDVGFLYSCMGNAYNSLDLPQLAIDHYKKALEFFKSGQFLWPAGVALLDIADSYREMGLFHQAKNAYHQVLNTRNDSDGMVLVARAKEQLSKLFALEGDGDKALEYAEEAKALCMFEEYVPGVQTANLAVGMANECLGRYQAAQKHYELAAAERDEPFAAPVAAESLMHIAFLKLRQGERDEGLEKLKEIIPVLKVKNYAKLLDEAQQKLAQVLEEPAPLAKDEPVLFE
jgi:tetratricopeptide (TPR) repeat protein